MQNIGIEKIDRIQKRGIFLLIAAFAAVYILWGSTYLAIKYVIETLPALISTGVRFSLAGTTLFLVGRFFKGYERPTLVQWRSSLITGTLLFLGGTGGVVMAERHLASSLAALLVATEPFWIVILSWLWLKGPRPTLKVSAGLLLGFAGVYFLISGNGAGPAVNGSNHAFGTILIIAATLCWATGSLYGMRAQVVKSPLIAAGMQMIAGGLMLLIAGTVLGEWKSFELAAVSRSSVLGLAYLLVFGSLIAFTSYSWLLKNAPPAIVATYAYVNPVIAVILGWAIAGESLTSQMSVGAAVIVSAVVLITSQKVEGKAGEKQIERIEEDCPGYPDPA